MLIEHFLCCLSSVLNRIDHDEYLDFKFMRKVFNDGTDQQRWKAKSRREFNEFTHWSYF